MNLSVGVVDASPKTRARIAGAFYLLTILTGTFAQGLISGRLVLVGDAAGTAGNILAHESLFRLGFTIYLVEMAAQITMIALFYDLLKPVNRNLSLLSAFFGLTGCVIKTFSRLFYFSPLIVLGGRHYLSVFSADQLQALALFLLDVNDQGAAIGLVFFGLSGLVKGYLIVRSTFLPRILGVLSILGGLGWLAFLDPRIGSRYFSYIAVLGLLGALAQITWLLVKGVNEQNWKEQAGAAAASLWR